MANVLLRRKAQISQYCPKLDSFQLIAPDQQVTGENPRKITPRNLHSLSKKALGAINIPEMLVELPKGKNGTMETNLASVAKDIFRSNFRYRTNITCGFTDAEQRYVLGMSQKTPYAKNYCDYSNGFSQFSMYVKLGRWEAQHLAAYHHSETSSGNTLPKRPFTMAHHPSSLVMDIPLSEETSIEISGKFGLDIHASFSPLRGDSK